MASTSLTQAPIAARKSHSFSHHGITLDDPYAWLRDSQYPTVNDPEILAYLAAENEYFEGFMQPIQPLVDELFEELKARRPAEDESVPYTKNGYRYQWRYAKDAQYRTWYRAPTDTPDSWALLLDERVLAQGHDYFQLGALAVSPDGEKLAYSTDTDGSERYLLQVVDIDSGDSLTPPIADTLDTPIWNSASDGLLYVVVNEQWQPLEVFYRDLTTPNVEDRLVFAERDSSFRVSLDISQSEEYVFISTGGHTSNEVYFLPQADLTSPPMLMTPREEDFEYHVDHGNGEFIIRSNLRESNFDIYRTKDTEPGKDSWTLWIQGDSSHYLTGHLVFADYLIVEERIDGLDQIRVIATDGTSHYINFGEDAYQASIGTNPGFKSATLRLSYTSMVTPQTVFEYDLDTRSLTTLKLQEIPSGYSADAFATSRLLATARDGTRVPVSLVYHRDTPIDGSAPLYLYGYGAYGYAIPPSFSPSRISLLERGFIFAIAHVRGGDDLGYHWYTQGKLNARTNTFNDFVDVAKFLVEENYVGVGNIAIAGGSAGGELMGAVVNQTPELWGAVAAHVPFVDVLNTMLDETLPLTPPEWSEWGNPITDRQAFETIQAYSPYDQLKSAAYPAMMVTAGLNDPRVTYWEPAKYVAKLRTLKTDDNVLLLKTNMGAGHGGQSGRFDALKELAEEYAFFITMLKSGVEV
jgi:oligopeptidase B